MIDLTHLKAGDKIAVPNMHRTWNGPTVEHEILTIDRITNTQIICGTSKYRRVNGICIGDLLKSCIEATPEIIEKNKKEIDDRRRWVSAAEKIDKIVYKIRQRNLTIEQMEAIIEAYEKSINNGGRND